MQPNPPHSTPEALLEHLDWVRRLARGLVADPNAADDLVQEAWISATRRPPHAGNLRGWLATVVRNAARERARKEARRAVHEERAARSEAQSSSDELAERVAVQQQVVQHVLELAEPYRETVLLRYFQELSPDEIAQRMRVPVATVKTRLRRALAELRERLDRAHGGDGRAWVLALLPLTQSHATFTKFGSGALLLMGTKTITGAALVVAALGLYFLTRGSAPVDLERIATAHTETASLEQSESTAANARDELAATEVEATRVATTSAERRMLVVDKVSGVPAVGAEVWYAITAESKAWNDGGIDRETYVRSIGTRLVADEAGTVLVPPCDRWIAAIGRLGDAYGETIFAKNSESGRIELEADVALQIQVVDESGAPRAGVGTLLFEVTPNSGSGYSLVSGVKGWTEAPDGVATIRHFSHRAPELLTKGVWATARIEATLVPPAQIDFDPRSLPAEPLRLVLPPTGRVVVEVRDAQGRALPDDWAFLSPVVRQVAEGGREVRGPRSDAFAKSGRTVFEHVGLGLELEASTSPREMPEVVTRFAGPREAGEEVVVTLRAGDSYPVLTGRVLDAEGTALARSLTGGRIVVERAGQAPEEHDLTARVDDEGRFRIVVRTTYATETRCRVHVHAKTKDGVVVSADFAPESPLRSGDIEVGDIVLTEPPVVLAGTVRDTSGAPVYWANVDFARTRGATEPESEPPYRWVSGQRAMTDKFGRFVSSGVLERGDYFVQVRANGYVDSARAPFVVGTRDWDVVLEKYGAVEGSILLGDGIDASQVVVEVEPHDSEDPSRKRLGGPVRVLPTGEFRLSDTPPGLVDVTLRMHGDFEALTTIERVEVPSGRDAADPRLRSIDLRGLALRQIRCTIRGPEQSAIKSAAIAIRPAGECDAPARWILCEDGDLTVLTRSPAIDLEVRAPGMRVARREAITKDVAIVMEAGIPLTVKLPDDFVLPEAPLQLALMLCPTVIHRPSYDARLIEERSFDGHQLYMWLAGGAARFEGREVHCVLPETGAYELEWQLARRGVEGAMLELIRDAPGAPKLVVSESDAGRVLLRAPDAADVEVARDRVLAR